MIQKDYMEEVIDYIEQHINQPFHIQDIPVCKYLSTMQLYRDFYNLTGHSVKEYIRKRRLSNALAMLKYSENSLLDIAYEYGYSSQQAFCKCVKACTGLTPMEYRSTDRYFFYPKFCYDIKHQVVVATENTPKTIHMKFYHSQLRGIENRSITYLFSILPNYKGRIFGRNGKQFSNRFCYELDIEYDYELISILEGSDFQDIDIEESQTDMYAKTVSKNKEVDINLAWDYLYQDWLKVSMFEQSDRTYFEEYVCKGNRVKRLVLYLPVRKRKDYSRIHLKECEDISFLVATCKGIDAEEKASKRVLDYLSDHNLVYRNQVDRYYISKNDGVYTCGVMIDKDIVIQNNILVEQLIIEGGRYAVLEGDCCGDSIVYEKILEAWIIDMGLHGDRLPCFSIYETNGSYEPEDIKMMVYWRLK
ncbi:MAG TPA: AraC family transcriptional regulator [Lachnospiraceae bacterium]|nr:AraC family transcriptional regulator [Lachnospiraceae bacterium]